jgi:hypothetical protein
MGLVYPRAGMSLMSDQVIGVLGSRGASLRWAQWMIADVSHITIMDRIVQNSSMLKVRESEG